MKNIFKVILFLSGMSAVAQQESQYTQYMYNTSIINPAYTGSRDVWSISGIYRTQWVGLEGAPQTSTFVMHGPVSDKVGLGLSVVNDKIGAQDKSIVSSDLSYNITLNEYYKLYFGLKVTASLLSIDFTKLQYDPSDPKFQYDIDNKFSPNVGWGIYLQSDRTYVGISSPFTYQTTQYDSSKESVFQERITYYLMAGHVFDLTPQLQFKPALLTKFTAGAPIQLDLSVNFLINEKLTLGAGYRLNSAVSGLVGFQITDGLFIGYSYDMDNSNLGNYNNGTHELFVRLDLVKKNHKVLSPRFF